MGCRISVVVPPAVFSKDTLEVEDLTSRVDHHNVVRNRLILPQLVDLLQTCQLEQGSGIRLCDFGELIQTELFGDGLPCGRGPRILFAMEVEGQLCEVLQRRDVVPEDQLVSKDGIEVLVHEVGGFSIADMAVLETVFRRL